MISRFCFVFAVFWLSGCSVKKHDDSQIFCRARGEIEVEGSGKKFRSRFEAGFFPDHHQMRMNLLSSLGTRSARIELSDTESTWRDGQGTRELSEIAVFRDWVSGPWRAELKMIFGLASKEAAQELLRVRCLNAGSERQCEFLSTKGRLMIDFDFLECNSAFKIK
jgi:hypothetical protein